MKWEQSGMLLCRTKW